MSSVRCVSSHREDLADGRVLAPGDRADGVDLGEPHNERLLEEGRIVEAAPSSEQLSGDDLQKRAKNLDIKGRSEMSADQLRAAVAEAERGDS